MNDNRFIIFYGWYFFHYHHFRVHSIKKKERRFRFQRIISKGLQITPTKITG